MSVVGQAIIFLATSLLFTTLPLSKVQEALFPKPEDVAKDPNKVCRVRLGFGDTNSSLSGNGLKQTLVPEIALYDVNGERLAMSDNQAIDIKPGEFAERLLDTSKTPEYIRITARQDAPEPFCLAWVTTTAATGDARFWNGGIAKQCRKPWYPSSALLPGTDLRVPCVWLSANPDVPSRYSLSYHLFDFAPADSAQAQARGQQWLQHPNTLCNAPARLQFYDTRSNPSNPVPRYPNQLSFNPDGTDTDFDVVVKGNRSPKDSIEYGSDNHAALYLDPDGKPSPEQPRPIFEVDPKAQWPAILATTEEPATIRKRSKNKKRGLVKRGPASFVRARSDEHEKCRRELVVVRETDDIDVEHMCHDPYSWGGDMVALKRGLYCDMCEHEVYDVCKTRTQMHCWDHDKRSLRVPAHRKREDGSSFPDDKYFTKVHDWE